jgi:hypothetical protein
MALRRKTCREFRAKDATLRTPLNPAGGESVMIRGREAILDFFNSILPAVRTLKLLHYYTGDGGWLPGRPEPRGEGDEDAAWLEYKSHHFDVTLARAVLS